MSELLAGLGSQAFIIPNPSEEAMRVTTFTKYNDLRSPRSPRPITPMTPHFTHDTVAEKSRKQIDLDVLRLEEQIRNLKSQRNGLAPVATLPPEMLAKIFSYRVLDDASGITPLNWIKVTHVSRHWRSVALDTPSLWSHIIFNHPKWAEEMLRRSKSAGLTIKSGVGMSTPRMRSIVEQALRQASRIHHLELSGGHGVVERVLTDLDFEGPMLRSLVLSGSATHYYYESDNIAVPEKVLQCDMPYLRHVQLTRCKVNWEAQHLSNLQELQLRQLPESSRPTMEQVVGMLSRMPTLQVLNLTDALPNVVSALSSPDIHHTMEFPALTQLSLSGRVQACTTLLRRIAIPPQAAVNLQCTAISPATTDSFSGVIEFVSAHQNAKGAKPIRMLHLTNRGYNSLQLHAWPKVYPKFGPVPMPDANLQLELNWSGASHTLEANIHDAIITSFAHAVSLGHLKVLKSFGTFNPLSLEVWRDGFGLLPKLQQITVQGRSASSLIPALIAERTETLSPTSPTTPRSSDLLSVRRPGLRRRKSTVPAVYFPALRKLELDGVSFDDFFLHESEHRDFLDVFLDVLMERCERKAEIQNLVISDCTRVDHDVVESIEDIVVDVEWDGIIMGYTDEEEEDEEEYSDDYWGYAGYNDYDDFSDDYPF